MLPIESPSNFVAIADAWDAMTGDRIYRKGMTVETAIGILEREADEGQFDPQLIRLFVAMARASAAVPGRKFVAQNSASLQAFQRAIFDVQPMV